MISAILGMPVYYAHYAFLESNIVTIYAAESITQCSSLYSFLDSTVTSPLRSRSYPPYPVFKHSQSVIFPQKIYA